MFSDHMIIKLKVKENKTFRKVSNIWKLSNSILKKKTMVRHKHIKKTN